MGSNDADAGKPVGKPPERRPGLGIKPAQFSFKPYADGSNGADNAKPVDKSQERRPGLCLDQARSLKPSEVAAILLPPLESGKYPDPEEFIRAYERREKSKKEIEKILGVNFADPCPSVKERKHRPGIFGDQRKPVSYRHVCESRNPGRESFLSSKDEPEQDIPGVIGEQNISNAADCLEVQSIAPMVESEEMIVAESVAPSEEKVTNKLLDELWSFNVEDLNRGAAVDFLRKNLHLKSFDISPLRPTYFPVIDSADVVNFDLNSSLPQTRSANLRDLFEGVHRKLSPRRNQAVGSSIHCVDSPGIVDGSLNQQLNQGDSFLPTDGDLVQKRSPIAKHGSKCLDHGDLKGLDIFSQLKSGTKNEIMETMTANMGSKELIDSPSPFNIDGLSYATSVETFDQELETELDISRKLKSSASDEMTTKSANFISGDLVTGHSDHVPDKSLTDYCTQQSVNIVIPCDISANSHGANSSDLWNDGYLSRHFEIDAQESTREFMGDSNQPALDSTIVSLADDHSSDRPVSASEIGQGLQTKKCPTKFSCEQDRENECPYATKKRKAPSCTEILTDTINVSPVEDHILDAPFTASEICLEPEKKYSRKSSNQQDKLKKPSHTGRKAKASQRESLAGAGTSMENGVRRSTRQRFRPLEYWKGERFLYGRVHGSLTTVIGVKYFSPAQDGKSALKVKSFVSGDYKKLVELSALH